MAYSMNINPLKRTGAKFVYEDFDRFGIYLWEMPDGRYVADDEGRFLSIAAEYGDVSRMSQLAQAARHYGINEGKPTFFPGHRKVTDEEYEEQKQRLESGLIPDDHDISALVEELRSNK